MTANNEIHKLEQKFVNREIKDYSKFVEGDFDPSLGKNIKRLIYRAESYIVYLDEELYIRWAINKKYQKEKASDFGLILGKISFLETLSHFQFDRNYLLSIEMLLGQSLGHLLDDGNSKNAEKIIEDVKQTIYIRSRKRYLLSATLSFMLIIAAYLLIQKLNLFDNYKDWTYSLLGSLGAYFSVIIGIRSFIPQMSIGSNVHYIDGILRIFTGILAAFIALLLIKSDLFLGFIGDTSSSFISAAICIIAGFSLYLIPGIMQKLESKFLSDSKNS